MTKEEIRKLLDNTKVYVNGKSKEIQEKLFSFGYDWFSGGYEVNYESKPFLFIYDSGKITYSDDMNFFIKDENKEITAEEILSLEITEPSYRPFNTKEECWQEMLKHQPFGWIKNKKNGNFYCIGEVSWSDAYREVIIIFSTSEMLQHSSVAVYNEYTFADGAPFGIKEDYV